MLRFLNILLTITIFTLSQQCVAGDSLDLSKYKCREFISDAETANDGSKLLRSMMAISWGTGYAAAHDKDHNRSDIKSFTLIGRAMGNICRSKPDEYLTQAFILKIDKFSQKDN